MDLIKDIVYETRYCDIIESKYTQHKIVENTDLVVKEVEVAKTLEELLLFKYDYNSVLQENPELYVNKRKMELGSFIDEHTEKTYDAFGYDKKFSKKLIQRGLQETDMLSTSLYLSDLYNFTIVLYEKMNDKYYKLSVKDKPLVYICYENKSFRYIEESNVLGDIVYENDINGLKDIVNCNVKDIHIYNKYLKAISNYKMEELVKIANELGVDKVKNGKKLVKKELYDNINMSKY